MFNVVRKHNETTTLHILTNFLFRSCLCCPIVKRGDKWNLNGIIQFQSHHLNQSSKRKNPLTYVFAIAWCCGLNQIVDIEGSKMLLSQHTRKNWNFSQIQFGIVSTSHNLCFLENERILPHQENALQGTFWQKYAIFWQYLTLIWPLNCKLNIWE